MEDSVKNKGCQSTDFITLEKDNELISGNRPPSLGYPLDPKCDEHASKAITSKYFVYPSVEKTKADFIGPSSILFNIFTNNLFLWISKSNLNTFVDDNTISEAENTIREGN